MVKQVIRNNPGNPRQIYNDLAKQVYVRPHGQTELLLQRILEFATFFEKIHDQHTTLLNEKKELKT